ncbi:MAG: nucleoside deaminase [Xanthomonadales bacterium]|nr:nucleoside deaminase [Xanthomonadales bacterium]
MKQSFYFQLPDWLVNTLDGISSGPLNDQAQMRLAIKLSQTNTEQGGGPFAALVVNRADNIIVAAGVNLVTSRNLSCAHAEMVAISMAQQNLDCYRLSDKGDFQLVSSCEPCAMCFGAIPWSGVSRVLCGAGKADAEAVGFDEGPKPQDWEAALEHRGIEVVTGLLRIEAAQVLASYADSRGEVY